VVAKAYIHRDKIKCAVDLLERGASQREIAKACGLSMSQVSAIGREYGYYADVKEHFEKLKEEKKREYESWKKSVLEERKRLEAELRELSEKVKALENEERELRKEVEDLHHANQSLRRELAYILRCSRIACFHYQRYRADAEKRLESLERVIGEDAWKFLQEIEILTSPELINDLMKLEALLNRITVAKEREYWENRFEKIENALRTLATLLHLREYLVSLMAVASLRDLCGVLDSLEKSLREGPVHFSTN